MSISNFAAPLFPKTAIQIKRLRSSPELYMLVINEIRADALRGMHLNTAAELFFAFEILVATGSPVRRHLGWGISLRTRACEFYGR
jgi:hypothetical protein